MFRPLLHFVAALVLSSVILIADEHLVDDGIVVSTAVAPGLVKHPMMAAFDDRGRLFVAENAGVNLDKAGLLAERPNSIKVLEDTNNDGIFDKVTLFADNLTFPQGALWVYDSLYVMSPPSLWRFADEDGDGYAEVREELVTGFDFTGNAADVHGPYLHPNGRLYWCHGRKGFAIPDRDTGEIIAQGKAARIWSSQLGGGEVESFAGGGMDNPVEIDFTIEGEILGTVNLFYGRPRGDVLVHWIHGGVYPRFDQGQVIAEFPRTGELLKPAHNFGHVGISGTTRYRSGALNPAWTDGWLAAHFNTGEVTITNVIQQGSTYTNKETRTIFRTLKPDTHFTDVFEDRNGDILVLDTGGWFRNGCPTSQIAKPDVTGTIYRLSKAESLPYRAPKYPKWDSLTSEQVSRYLEAPEDWLRERASTELAVRGNPAFPELERILTEGQANASARIYAVWTLAKMKFSEATDLIYGALTDPDARVRQAACNAIAVTRTWQIIAANQPAERAIELERNKTISGALAGIVRGDDAAVARAAAAALGRMGEARAIGALTGRLGRVEDDRFLEHALIYALIEIDDFDATHEGLNSSVPSIQSGTLRALDEMPSSKLAVLDVLAFLEADNAELRETARSIITKHQEWDAALANAFFDWSKEIDATRRELLHHIVPGFAASPPMVDYLTGLVASSDPELQILGLELIAAATGVPFQKEWIPTFEAALAPDASEALLTPAIHALVASRSSHFTEALEAFCADQSKSLDLRLTAAKAIAQPKSPLPEEAFALLLETLTDSSDFNLRSRAIALLTSAPMTPDQRDRLAPLVASFGPVDWNSFTDLFKTIDTPEQASILAEALVVAPVLHTLSEELIKTRFAKFPEPLALIESALAAAEADRARRGAAIEELVTSLKDADADAGKAVFSAGKGACIACHRIGDLGGEIGPDLSTIGRIRTPSDLFESILYPSESIARDFETYELTSKSTGAVHVGVIREQTSKGLELVGPSGQIEAIPHEDVASIRRTATSLMPMGLEQTLAPEELRDLVAYLLSLK